MVKVLIVEDDEKLNKLVCVTLSGKGFLSVGAKNGKDALKLLESDKFDIVLSDIMMPEMDGFEFAKNVRMFDKNIPILFMTARDDIEAKQKGYAIGIDDYIVKPFSLDELELRIGALLRRAKINASKKIELGNFVMDEEEHIAKIGEHEIPLSVREFDILFKLLSFPNKTFTRSALMEEFWDYDSSSSSRTVDVYMSKLREKTAQISEFEISTVHGLGYKAVLK